MTASRATTWAELTPLFADLPDPRPVEVSAALAQAPAPVPAAAGLPLPERARETIMSVTPIAALILFFVTGHWWWFLVIPLVGALLYGATAAGAAAATGTAAATAERAARVEADQSGRILPGGSAAPGQSVGSEKRGSRPSPCEPPRRPRNGASSATATAVSSSGSTGPRWPGVSSSSPVAMALSSTAGSPRPPGPAPAGRSGVTAPGSMSPSRGTSSALISLMLEDYPAGAGSTALTGPDDRRGERTVIHERTPPSASRAARATMARPAAAPKLAGSA